MKFDVEVREGKDKGAFIYRGVCAESKYAAEKAACKSHRLMFDVKGIELIATSRIVRA